jgi:putative addiction module component (TIGR02574 family)
MPATLETVEHEAMGLPAAERAFLADRLLRSLGGEAFTDVDIAWVAEAERRYAEYKVGTRKPIPASDVFAEANRIIE